MTVGALVQPVKPTMIVTVDKKWGSFRQIDVMRNNKVVASADLYAFFRDGKLPSLSFKDGDIILVHPIGNTITVETGARNSFTSSS